MSKRFIDELEDAMNACDGSSAYRSDPNRPYDGQPHTNTGERGKTEIKGITFRDLRDCFVRAAFLASYGDPHSKTQKQIDAYEYVASEVYKLDWNKMDVLAVAQCMSCEVEKLMGIYPNVPPLNLDDDLGA